MVVEVIFTTAGLTALYIVTVFCSSGEGVMSASPAAAADEETSVKTARSRRSGLCQIHHPVRSPRSAVTNSRVQIDLFFIASPAHVISEGVRTTDGKFYHARSPR